MALGRGSGGLLGVQRVARICGEGWRICWFGRGRNSRVWIGSGFCGRARFLGVVGVQFAIQVAAFALRVAAFALQVLIVCKV